MTSYMVEIDLPDNYTEQSNNINSKGFLEQSNNINPKVFLEEFEQRIPHQRYMVNKLMEKGTILSYSLAADKGKLWIITHAASKTQVRNMISRLPLYDFFVEYIIHELMYSETVQVSMPQPSLN